MQLLSQRVLTHLYSWPLVLLFCINLFAVCICLINNTFAIGAPEKLSGITFGSYHWYIEPCPGPWVQASLTTNSFLDTSTTSTLYSWFYLLYLIWYYLLFVCQIFHVNCETENWKYKKFIFNKITTHLHVWSILN